MVSDAFDVRFLASRHCSRAPRAEATLLRPWDEGFHMSATTRSREGMALPMVLGSITLIGTMVAGVMYLATQDYRVGANTLNETRAGAAAEMGLNRTLTDWDKTRNNTMAAGDTVRKSYTDPSGATANVFITR